jgi:hypothetical protein
VLGRSGWFDCCSLNLARGAGFVVDLGWLVILTRSAMGLVSDCRSAIEEEMWFWEGMSSLATSLKILFWASPNCSEDFCRLPLS